MATNPISLSSRAPGADSARDVRHPALALGGRRRLALGAAIGVTVVAMICPLALVSGRAFAAEPSITDVISLPGDQVVTVPNGTYSGGTVVAPHPTTSGPYGGWLVLVA